MHGVSRIKTKTSEQLEKEKKQEELKKIALYNDLTSKVLQMSKNNVYDKEALDVTNQLLCMNSEFYSLWNYRRRIFQHKLETQTKEELQSLFESELAFIEQLIPHNPKSYWMWLHRVWVTSHMANCNWQRELKLCGKMLSVDERNFHCWDYRRYASKNAKATLEEEFRFTTQKIEDNFSNYSAWHQRSAIIPQLFGSDRTKLLEKLNEEFDLMKNAFYTEPSDQSIWFYYKWLIEQICTITSGKEQQDILMRELEMCNELRKVLEDEKHTNLQRVEPRKWPILTSNFIMKKLGGHEAAILENFKLLQQIDPLRSQYYSSLAQAN